MAFLVSNTVPFKPTATRYPSHISTSPTRHIRIITPQRTRWTSSAVEKQATKPKSEHKTNSPQRYFETFRWRGYSINYRADGPEDGQPVLIVHGFGASINHWRKNIPALVATDQLRVYTIDLLGFGGSDKASPDEVEYGISLWRDLLCDFVNEKHPEEKWCLVGNSIGSLTCLATAVQLGEGRVRGCALINSAGGMVSFRYSDLNPLQTVLLRAFNAVLFNRFTGPYLFENFRKPKTIANVLKQIYINQDAISDELVDILCDPSMDEGACAVFLAVLNGDAGPRPEDLLQELNWCPMLVVWGEKDPWTPLRYGFNPGIKFPDYHPGIDLRIIPEAGHCVHDECPDIVNEMLVSFLLAPELKSGNSGNGVSS